MLNSDLARHARPRSKGHWLSFLLVALVAASSAGCSFVFVEGPKPGTAAACTDSLIFPGVDFAGATYEGLRLAYIATRSDAASAGALIPKKADIALASGALALFAVSGIVGALNVSACRAAIAQEIGRAHV